MRRSLRVNNIADFDSYRPWRFSGFLVFCLGRRGRDVELDNTCDNVKFCNKEIIAHFNFLTCQEDIFDPMKFCSP